MKFKWSENLKMFYVKEYDHSIGKEKITWSFNAKKEKFLHWCDNSTYHPVKPYSRKCWKCHEKMPDVVYYQSLLRKLDV